MEDGLDHGRLAATHDSLSMLRTAAAERLRQRLGAEGLAKASPLALAEGANEVLDALVGAAEAKPTLAEQRQILRDVVEVLKAERAAAAPKKVEAAGEVCRAGRIRSTTPSPRAGPRPRPSSGTSASSRSRRR